MNPDPFEKYGSTHNKESMFYSQKNKTKTCPCGRGPLYTGGNSKHNAVVNNRQVCNECFVDSIYEKAGLSRG